MHAKSDDTKQRARRALHRERVVFLLLAALVLHRLSTSDTERSERRPIHVVPLRAPLAGPDDIREDARVTPARTSLLHGARALSRGVARGSKSHI